MKELNIKDIYRIQHLMMVHHNIRLGFSSSKKDGFKLYKLEEFDLEE